LWKLRIFGGVSWFFAAYHGLNRRSGVEKVLGKVHTLCFEPNALLFPALLATQKFFGNFQKVD